MVQRRPAEPSLDELVSLVADHVDLVLTEGFRGSGKPQVLVARAAQGLDPDLERGEHLAIVSDVPTARPEPVEGRTPLMVRQAHHERVPPRFDFAAASQLTDFLLAHFGLAPRATQR